jgi:hypothetical protein
MSIAKGHPGHIRKFAKRTIFRVVLTRGVGTDDSPCREVVQWWLPTGELLIEVDPCADLLPGEKAS